MRQLKVRAEGQSSAIVKSARVSVKGVKHRLPYGLGVPGADQATAPVGSEDLESNGDQD